MNERSEIEGYYDKGVQIEWTRMDRRPTEFELTKRHIQSLISPSSRIADIGGGPGRYAIHFASAGHKVTLVDLSQSNIDRAKAEAAKQGVDIEQFHHLSATQLSDLKTASYDAVLCLGPLYHLTAEDERKKAIAECLRILKDHGLLFVAFISPYAHAISLIARNELIQMKDVKEEFEHILSEGRNRSPELLSFTHAWYPAPSGIRDFMEGEGLNTEKVACLEPLGWANDERLLSLPPNVREYWNEYMYRISTDPSIIGATQHILYCGRK
jgi:S-adenosylmethionine-dependent methyltransferase